MTNNDALKKAYAFFKDEFKISGIAYAAVIDNGWVIFAGNPDEFIVGRPVILINKDTGEITPFSLADKNNAGMLDNKTVIEIPEEFRM